MDKALIVKLHKNFEDYMHTDENGIEFWYARELQELLGYVKWDTFKNVIEKAKEACKNSGQQIEDHFPDVGKTIQMPKSAEKEIKDMKLSRYACYLITQNGDPRKEVIAFAQTYFAIQTRKQEVLEQRLDEMERLQARQKLTESDKLLSKVIFERGIDNCGFGRIKSKGDEALFCKTTNQMKEKLGIKNKNKPLADVLPTITLKAKDFANEITAFNTNEHNLHNEAQITDEHIKNNESVREVLTSRSIYPENLPLEEDIKKVQRRFDKEAKQLPENKTKKLESKEDK